MSQQESLSLPLAKWVSAPHADAGISKQRFCFLPLCHSYPGSQSDLILQRGSCDVPQSPPVTPSPCLTELSLCPLQWLTVPTHPSPCPLLPHCSQAAPDSWPSLPRSWLCARRFSFLSSPSLPGLPGKSVCNPAASPLIARLSLTLCFFLFWCLPSFSVSLPVSPFALWFQGR